MSTSEHGSASYDAIVIGGGVSGLAAAAYLAAMLGGHKGPAFDPEPALKSGGCKFVRVLGEKEGLRFVEGTKARA